MLRDWMLNEHYFGPTAMDDADVSGLAIDDRWNAHGLTEEGPGWQEEMELTATDLATMVREYNKTMNEVQKKVLNSGGFINNLLQPSGPFPPHPLPNHSWLSPNNQSKATCTTWLRSACVLEAPLSKLPLMHFFSIKAKGAFGELPSLLQDLASFLLVSYLPNACFPIPTSKHSFL